MVAVCSVGKTDINARMVVLGWALAYQRYSMDYVDEKAAAMVSSRFIMCGQANAMPLFSESSNFGAVDCIASLCVFYFKSAVWRFLS
jgi:hypothetical protein